MAYFKHARLRRKKRKIALSRILTKYSYFDWNKFWYKNGEFYWFEGWQEHADMAWNWWGDQITETLGVEDPAIEEIREQNPDLADAEIEEYRKNFEGRQYIFGPMFKMSWIRGGLLADRSSIYLHSPLLKDHYKLKDVIKKLADEEPGIIEKDALIEVACAVDWEPTPQDHNVKVSEVLGFGKQTINDQIEEFWEAGPADQWIARIHKDLGVAKLRKRRTLRAKILEGMM